MQNKTLSVFSDIGLLQITQCMCISLPLYLIFLFFIKKKRKNGKNDRKENMIDIKKLAQRASF